MGVFDYIKFIDGVVVKYSGIDTSIVYQTKSLDSHMDEFVVRGDTLHRLLVEYRTVPEEKRPYYGKAEWGVESGELGNWYRLIGSVEPVALGEVFVPYSGAALCKGASATEWVSFICLFVNGKLTGIVEKVVEPENKA